LVSCRDNEREFITSDSVSTFGQYIKTLLSEKQSFDSILVSLNIIVTKIIECISFASIIHKTPLKKYVIGENRYLLTYYKTLMTNIISIVRNSLNTIQFVSLFTSIGRQLEPCHFSILFPLYHFSSEKEFLKYVSKTSIDLTTQKCKNICWSDMKITNLKDLFAFSIQVGSVPAAISVLSLSSEIDWSHEQCCKIFHHCINTLFKVFNIRDRGKLTHLLNEYIFMQQLFRYGYLLKQYIQHDSNVNEYKSSYNVIESIEMKTSNVEKSNFMQIIDSDFTYVKHESFFLETESLLYKNRLKENFTKLSLSTNLISNIDSLFMENFEKNDKLLIEEHNVIIGKKYSIIHTVAKATISSIFETKLTQLNRRKHLLGLRKVAALKMILQVDSQSSHISKVTLSLVQRQISSLSKQDLEPIIAWHYSDNLVDVLHSLMMLYKLELNKDTASLIFEFILDIFVLKDDLCDMKSMFGPLVYVLIACGHICNRCINILTCETCKKNLLYMIYDECRKRDVLIRLCK